MLPGAWRLSGAVPTIRLAGTVKGAPVTVADVTIKQSAAGGNPFATTQSGISTKATLTLLGPTEDVHTPWDGSPWPPRRGDSVQVSIGDDAGGQWGVIAGTLDAVPGSLTGADVQVDTIDAVDSLARQVQLEPLLAQMPPVDPSQAMRYPGLCAEWVLDAIGAQVGYPAAPAGGPGARVLLRASMIGSSHPGVGTLVAAGRPDNPAAYGYAVLTPGGRPLWSNMTAWYDLASSAADIRLTWETATQGPGESARVVLHQGTARTDGIQVDTTGTDGIVVSSLIGGATSVILRGTRTDTDPIVTVATAVKGGGDLEVTATIGGVTTTATINLGTGWVADRCYCVGPGRFGAVLVTRAADPVAPATMRIRCSLLTYLSATPQISGQFLQILTDWARLLGADTWMNSTTPGGMVEWRSRRYLDTRPPVTVAFDTGGSLDQLQWVDDQGALRSSLTLKWRQPAITLRTTPLANAWLATSAQQMNPGDTQEFWVQPDGDHSWIGVPQAVQWLTGPEGTMPGNWVAGAVILKDDTERGPNSDEIVAAWSWVSPSVCKFTVTLKSLPAGARFELRAPKTAYHAQMPMPVFRGTAITEWTDQTSTWNTGALGPAEDFDGGTVLGHHPQTISSWVTDMTAWATDPAPTLTGVTVAYDPRTQIGDKVTITDPHLTGLAANLVVLSIDARPLQDQMVLGGRLVDAHATHPTEVQS